MKNIILLPKPRTITYSNGVLAFGKLNIGNCELNYNLLSLIKNILNDVLPKIEGEQCIVVMFKKNVAIHPQGYSLEVNQNGILIQYADPQGALFAVTTLKQLIFQGENGIPFVLIEDYPDFANRGFMLDVSRDKIPTLDTVKRIIDLMVDIKFNQLQLYIEGFSFAYPSFPQVWENGTPYTPDDIAEIVAYCNERLIECVPNVNSFGHMDAWVGHPDFKHLAECEGGYENEDGSHGYPSTFALTEDYVVKHVDQMYSDYLPPFTSEYLNVGADETYEVGLGKSGRLGLDKGQTFLAMLMQLYKLAKKHNKTMMYWADIVMKYPEIIKDLPKDAVAMNWGYEFDHDFPTETGHLKGAGVPFYVCPGTGSWNGVMGRYQCMIPNVKNAVTNGLKNGATGMLMTDWGDGGHWQYLPISYFGFAYGAATSWCLETNEDVDFAGFLSRFIFKDKTEKAGELFLKIGMTPEIMTRCWNNTYLNGICWTSHNDNNMIEQLIKFNERGPFSGKEEHKKLDVIEQCNEIIRLANEFRENIKKCELTSEDGNIVMLEAEWGARLLIVQGEYAAMRLRLYKGVTTKEQEKAKAAELLQEMHKIKEKHKEIWLLRNRYGGLDDSLGRMGYPIAMYEEIVNA